MKNPSVSKRAIMLMVAIVSSSMVVIVFAGCAAGNSGSSGEYLHYFTADDRLEQSEAVVRAILLGEEEYSRPVISPVTKESVGEISGAFREYQVAETFKGDLVTGDIIYVPSSSSVIVARPEGETVVEPGLVELSIGAEYILFLRPRPALESDPEKVGDTRWSHWGEPGLAQVVDGELRFLGTKTYARAVEERGQSSALAGSVAPFRITVEELNALREAESR